MGPPPALVPWAVLEPACALASSVCPNPVLLGADECLIGRTVAAATGLNLPLAQVSSKHCRILRVGSREVAASGIELLGGQPENTLAYVVDLSTNGALLHRTFLNGEKLVRNVPTPLREDDLLCFASPDLAFDKAVGFKFYGYTAAADAPQRGGAGGCVNLTPNKRGRQSDAAVAQASPGPRPPGGGEAAYALDVHASNNALRAKQAELTAALAALTASAGAKEAAAAEKVASLKGALAAATAAASAAEAAASAGVEAARSEAEAATAAAREAVASSEERAAASATTAAEALQEATRARAERDAMRAERDAAEEGRGAMETAAEKARASLREEGKRVSALRDELRAATSSLLSERGEKHALLKRAEGAEQAVASSAATADASKEKCAAAEARAATATAATAVAESRLAKLLDDTRGLREGTALTGAFAQHLIDFVKTTHAACAIALPHAHALAVAGAAAAAAVAAAVASENALAGGAHADGGAALALSPPRPPAGGESSPGGAVNPTQRLAPRGAHADGGTQTLVEEPAHDMVDAGNAGHLENNTGNGVAAGAGGDAPPLSPVRRCTLLHGSMAPESMPSQERGGAMQPEPGVEDDEGDGYVPVSSTFPTESEAARMEADAQHAAD